MKGAAISALDLAIEKNGAVRHAQDWTERVQLVRVRIVYAWNPNASTNVNQFERLPRPL